MKTKNIIKKLDRKHFLILNCMFNFKIILAKLQKSLNRDFQCTECGRTFTSNKLLQQHSVVHKGRKFLCGVCGKCFVRKVYLDDHAKV